jgi:hypothetical protein
MMRFKAGADNLLSQIRELEEIAEDTAPKRTVTKEEFKKQLRDSGDFTSKQLEVFDALVDSLNTDMMPEYNSDEKSLELVGIKAGKWPNFYTFVENILSAKKPEAFIHEVGHFAFYNILSKEDRLSFLEGMIDSFYGQGKPTMKSKLAMTSEKVTTVSEGKELEFSSNVGDNFSEYFAEQFRQWYLKEKTTPSEFDSIFEKVEKFLEKLVNKLRTGEYVDKSLVKYFDKIIVGKQAAAETKAVSKEAQAEAKPAEKKAEPKKAKVEKKGEQRIGSAKEQKPKKAKTKVVVPAVNTSLPAKKVVSGKAAAKKSTKPVDETPAPAAAPVTESFAVDSAFDNFEVDLSDLA